MSKPIRFKALVKTLAEFATDVFAGRIGIASDIHRFIFSEDGTTYAQVARRDVLETFAAGINAQGPGISATTVKATDQAGTGDRMTQSASDGTQSAPNPIGATGVAILGSATVADALAILGTTAMQAIYFDSIAVQDITQGVDMTISTIDVSAAPAGLWEIFGWVKVVPLSSSGPFVPNTLSLKTYYGATLIQSNAFESARYYDAIIKTTDTYQIPVAFHDNTTGSSVISLKINGAVGTGGGDTFRVSAGKFILRRVVSP
jgi:hypothetical protein